MILSIDGFKTEYPIGESLFIITTKLMKETMHLRGDMQSYASMRHTGCGFVGSKDQSRADKLNERLASLRTTMFARYDRDLVLRQYPFLAEGMGAEETKA